MTTGTVPPLSPEEEARARELGPLSPELQRRLWATLDAARTPRETPELIDEFTTFLYEQTKLLAANAEGDAEPCGWNVHAEAASIRTFWINLVDKHDAWHLAARTPRETPEQSDREWNAVEHVHRGDWCAPCIAQGRVAERHDIAGGATEAPVAPRETPDLGLRELAEPLIEAWPYPGERSIVRAVLGIPVLPGPESPYLAEESSGG